MPDLLKLKSRWYDTMLQKWFCVLSERTQPRASSVTYRAASMARKYHTLEDANAPDWVPAWLKVPAVDQRIGSSFAPRAQAEG